VANGVCDRCGGKYLIVGTCNGGPIGRDAFQPKGLNWFNREFGPLVYALHDRHTACLSCGLVCSEVRPEELRELVERKGLQKGTASGVSTCVRCREQDLIDCRCGGSGKPVGYGFRPEGMSWLVIPSLSPPIAHPLYKEHVACLSCGVVWFEVRPEELQELIEREGTEDLKRLLPPIGGGTVASDPHRSPERLRSGTNPHRRGMNTKLLATAHPLRLLDRIQGQASERKLRLLICACVRAIRGTFLNTRRPTQIVEVAERFADGLATADELRAAREEGFDPDSPDPWKGWIALPDAFEAAQYVIPECLAHDQADFWVWERQRRRECRTPYNRLVADVFDLLLSRPVAFDADWKTSTAVALAQQMYDSRDFSTMPILADALQDAGCDSDDILNHCRDPEQPHVRGCWVVDLVLGKE
jgi:hypothetical protein